jgi:hypothetical protein
LGITLSSKPLQDNHDDKASKAKKDGGEQHHCRHLH